MKRVGGMEHFRIWFSGGWLGKHYIKKLCFFGWRDILGFLMLKGRHFEEAGMEALQGIRDGALSRPPVLLWIEKELGGVRGRMRDGFCTKLALPRA